MLRCTPEFSAFGLSEDEAGRGLIFKRDEWAPVPKQEDPEAEPEHFAPDTYRVVKFEKAAER